MAPKIGTKGYKGPVHEAVRTGLGTLGVNLGGSKPAAPPRPSVSPQTRQQTLANKAGNYRNEVMSRMNKGQTREGAEESMRMHNIVMPTVPAKAVPAPSTRTVRGSKPKATKTRSRSRTAKRPAY